MNEIEYMKKAIDASKSAGNAGDVPIGAVLVCNGEIISASGNTKEAFGRAICHAEINVIDEACRKLGRWRLSDCTLYVTMEPCPMCAGAILSARIPTVYYGIKDPNGGAYGSVFDMRAYPVAHKPNVIGGLLETECKAVVTGFFQNKRKKSVD